MALASALFLPKGSLAFALLGDRWKNDYKEDCPGPWELRVWERRLVTAWWRVGVRLGWESRGKSEESRVKASARSAWLPGESTGSQTG